MQNDIRSTAHQFLIGEVIAAAARHFQTLGKPFKNLRQAEQEEVLRDMRESVETATRAAVELIAADDRYVYRAHCKKVNFGEDGVTATIELPNTPEAHDLADRAGQTVLVINEDGRRYLGGDDIIQAASDERALFDSMADPA